MSPRKGRVKKEGPESGEDSDEYRKKRDRNNLVNIRHWVSVEVIQGLFLGGKTQSS